MDGQKVVSLALRYIAVFVGALILYAISCAPSYLWQDSGWIQYRVLNNDLKGFFGLAVSHPLYYWLAIPLKFFLPSLFPYSINLISALAGAFTVANVFLLVTLWGGTLTPLPGLIASLCLAVSHTFWRHACITETYTLWAALFTTELLILQAFHASGKKGYLFGLACVNGLSMSVHVLSIIPLVCYLYFVIRRLFFQQIRFLTILKMVFMWLMGALPLILIIAERAIITGDLAGSFESLLYGDRWRDSVLNMNVTWPLMKENLLYLVLNFPTPLLLVSLIGLGALIRIRRRGRGIRQVFFLLTMLFLVFAFRYDVPDRYAFFIPFYIMLAIIIGFGVKAILKRVPYPVLGVLGIFLALVPVIIYPLLPLGLNTFNVTMPTRNDVPYRDDQTFFLFPWKTGDRGAERYAREALEGADRDAIIFADLTTASPLLTYQKREKIRPDVKIISAVASTQDAPLLNQENLGSLIQQRTFYLTSITPGYYPKYIPEHYKFEQAGVLWKVKQH